MIISNTRKSKSTLIFFNILVVLNFIFFLVFSSLSYADNSFSNPQNTKYDKRCFADVPPYVENNSSSNPATTPISITSDKVQAELNQDIYYSGNVEIVHGNKVLKANNTTFNQETQEMSATGDIFYQDGEITISSEDELTTNLQTNDTKLSNAQYHINGTLIHGETDSAVLNSKKQSLQLKNASVTTCPKNEETWAISSSEINIDQNEVFGEAYHTVFRLHDIPIMYLPYINFPVKSERKSGVLYPNLSFGNSDGIKFELPIYWNIAPNYDMTFTPIFIQRRGILLTDEFRYMPFKNTIGKLYGEYIPHDRKHEDDGVQKFEERYLLHLEHQSTWFDGDLGLNINYSKVNSGDLNYINDFDSPNVETLDSQLTQLASLYVDKPTFEGEIKVLSYQTLISEEYLYNIPFKLLPQIKANYHNALKGLLSYNVNFVFSNFEASSKYENETFEAQRYHFEPTVTIPFVYYEGIDLNAKGSILYTYYNQNVPDTLHHFYTTQGFSNRELENSIDRLLYRTELNGKMTFANTLENLYTLTIEPQFQYMYIPYKNQDNIGLYDTTDRVFDFYSIFSYRNYAGLDRISDTNRFSYGFSYSIYDENYHEKLRFNIGQAYDFVPKRVRLYPNDTKNYYPRTPIASTLDLNLIDSISLHGDIVYNTEKNETASWNSMLNVNYEELMGQISYRYNRNGNRTSNNEIIDLKQLGILMKLPVTPDLTLIAGGYRDLEQGLDIDKKLALKYESCCYSVGFQIERYNKPNNYTMTSDNETTLGVFFELKGLANVGVNSEFSPSTKLIPYTDTVNLNK